MKVISEWTVCVLAVAFIASCQKQFVDPDPALTRTFANYDPSTQQFIDSAGISDTVLSNALNTFVVALKDSALWGEFRAIYPMIGGTASSTKWNLINPQNTDAAFRLTFYGAPAFSAAG